MKAENAILGLLGITIVTGIGFSIYKKVKNKPLAEGGANPGGNPNDATRGADGVFVPKKDTATAQTSHLKTASTRSEAFQPVGAGPAGKKVAGNTKAERCANSGGVWNGYRCVMPNH